MYKYYRRNQNIILVLLCMLLSIAGFSQQVSPVAQDGGVTAQLSVSVPTIRSEEPFKYILNFTMADGVSMASGGITIDPNLVIDNVVYPTNYSTNVPYVNWTSSPGFIIFLFGPYAPIHGPIGGSVEINVHLPANKACDGTTLSATAGFTGESLSFDVSTSPVVTTVNIDNHWKIQKFPTGLPYIGNACPYGTLSETVGFGVRIVKEHPTPVGSQTISNINLIDDFPLGSVINTSGPYTHSANMAGTTLTSTGISFPPGFVLDPQNNIPYDAFFTITFPTMATGSCVTNKVDLTALDPCGNPIDALHDEVKVQKIDALPPPNSMVKQVFPDGNRPGCTGTYKITVSGGTSGIGLYHLQDVLPLELLTVGLVSKPASSTITPALPAAGGTTIDISNTGISPGGTDTYIFSYQINPNCTSPTIVNTVSVTSGFFAPPYPATIYLLPIEAKACLQKTICSYNPNGYHIGDHVRFRIRVQNIGGSEIVTPRIHDLIDVGNLQYVMGSESYYSMPNAAPITGCVPAGGVATGGTAWTGITIGTVIPGIPYENHSFNLPTIPVGEQCAVVPTPYCGSAYNLPAYYIEFDALIINDAGIGNVRNICDIQAAGVSVGANTTFLVNNPVNYTIEKEVSTDGIVYHPLVGVTAGSTVFYKLQGINHGASLINPVIVDLMPRDNGTIDEYILNNNTRPSNIDIRMGTFINSNIPGYVHSSDNTPGAKIYTTPELGITSGGVPPGWNPGFITGWANFKTQYSQPIHTATNLEYIFNATVSPYAVEKDVACNTFALRASVKYIQNYLDQIRPLVPLESKTACVEVKSKDSCCTPYDFEIPERICAGISALFEVKDSCPGVNVYTWDFGDGTPTVTGMMVYHNYTVPGYYVIKITWKGSCEGGEEFHIKVEDCTCKIDVSWTINQNGFNVTADGSATTSSFPIVLYVWDFGDGTGPITTTTAIPVSHTYLAYGNYDVTLTIYTLNDKGEICQCVDKCSSRILVNEGQKIYYCNPRGEDGRGEQGRVKEIAYGINMIATPNPFREKISVNFQSGKEAKKNGQYLLEFINETGTALQKKQLSNLDKPVVFNTQNYTSGLYFIMLKDTNGRVQSIKVVKLD